MQKIIYVPPGGNFDIPETCAEFSLTPPYILGSVNGTAGTENTIISSTVPGLDGVYVHGVRTESREISCYIHVEGKDRLDMYEKRFSLIQKLAVSDIPGTLYYFNDFISMRIKAFPISSPDFTERFGRYNKAELRFYCPYPFWESLADKSGYMAYLDEGFTFPFEFDIQFAALENKTSLFNNGSVSAPLQIIIKGPANHPFIINETTGEKLKISRSLDEGESMYIDTQRGNKQVVITHSDGTKEDAFHYIEADSEFFSLIPGENKLRYQSLDESEKTQVFLRYRELYAGV